ncbi:MAG TPA: DNA gyrase inhibitor YacG [Rheinheimera sp.]|uniref:DNA gyrase inhibitor YacG n=1 Tax=unclassified Rheinheimera TaxID=115860 RepID=UPI000EC1AD2E|nr:MULTISPECIES: DNA gyrase inhibitor YacG [unclassified Rheinheimera]MCT6698430.1 DNA gyrase inhibitor YacG [Rheinheimera sp. 4Y26]HCU67432.1 DNA gyrase inhibitor YacG [Rheinheimera sp.]
MSELKVQCPTCQTEVLWGPQSPFRPFCSERCRLIDLGEWASESRRIADKQPIEAGIGDADLMALEDELMQQDNKFFQ